MQKYPTARNPERGGRLPKGQAAHHAGSRRAAAAVPMGATSVHARCPQASRTLSQSDGREPPFLVFSILRAVLIAGEEKVKIARPVLTALLIWCMPLGAQNRVPLLVFGGQGHKEFLGCLNCSDTHPRSVWNENSSFGFMNDDGKWNSWGQFANDRSRHSMCSDYAADPPVVVDEEGNAYGRLSINERAPGSVCGHRGNERMCQTVRAICATK